MKKTIAIALTSIMFVSSVLVVSAQEMSNERSINPNLVISTNQNITIPNNVKHVSIKSSINFDHDAGIVWNGVAM